MSKNKYVLLGFSAAIALAIVGYGTWKGSLVMPSLHINNSAAVGQTPSFGRSRGEFPRMQLSRDTRGEEIVREWGDKLPEVARWYQVSEGELKEKVKDRTLHADKQGRLYYVEQETIGVQNAVGVTASALTAGGFQPLEQTFALHSKPGSSKTLYLDFNGHLFLAGKSIWISTDFNAPAFDLDGSPTTFNDNERQIIQNVWLRVAEDYAPFDIDVTTEEPTQAQLERSSTSDTIFGNRVLFTPSSGTFSPGSGGVSYVSVFDDIGETTKIALVFPENLGYYDKYIADAASHEAGHSLGLWHDGQTNVTDYYSGHAGWAPIMGLSYYGNITQWSKGEYSGANNTQDDLQTIISTGLAYRADDYGNSISTAGSIAVSNNSISASGLIERNTDVDYFKFNTSGGDIAININVAYLGANLDVLANLYNASGGIIATNDSAGLPATITANIPAGTYYLAIKGTGMGTASTGYTNYGSLGQYYITGTIPSGTTNNAPTAVISANPSAGTPPLAVSFSSSGSYDPEGSALTYAWNFGDNTSSTEPNPTKTYSAGGTYTATLTVTDAANLSSSNSIQIVVSSQSPTASFTTNTASNVVPMTVAFDASSSSDPDGTITSYAWDFGDGTTDQGTTINHTYTKSGKYTARLTVTDNQGLSASKSISLTANDPVGNQPPVANITTNTTSGNVPLVVTFSGANSSDVDGSIVSYAWTFGDGTAGTDSVVSHTYSIAGSYTATLTVTDDKGATASRSVTITVKSTVTTNKAPIASFTANYTTNLIPMTVALDAGGSTDSDGSIVSYAWNFGDGTTGTGVNTSKTYSAAGTYTIRLTVTDDKGAVTSKTTSVTAIDGSIVKAPTRLNESVNGKQASLTWTDNSSNETNFVIERGQKSSKWGSITFTEVARVGANVTKFSETLSTGTYYYRVKAINTNTGIQSAYTSTVNIRIR